MYVGTWNEHLLLLKCQRQQTWDDFIRLTVNESSCGRGESIRNKTKINQINKQTK